MAATETSARANAVLDELYREHVGDVYRYTYAVLGNHADAEDVTQTTFVNALRALERGEVPEEPSRWLTVIAHNLVRQRWRQAAARPTLVELETDVADAEDHEEAFELEELVRALQRIPETQREAIVMRELEGRSYREIATVMGLSTSALETLLFRARRSLADELENVVTCQNAELALSKSIDGRLSRKERRRLDEHLADCPDCARLAATQQRRRRAFKGLALLPLPIGLALFKGAPSAAAATSLPTIGLGTAGAGSSGTGGPVQPVQARPPRRRPAAPPWEARSRAASSSRSLPSSSRPRSRQASATRASSPCVTRPPRPRPQTSRTRRARRAPRTPRSRHGRRTQRM